ncbi:MULTISPECIES: hypothetical protein [unclassified Streptomyces]|uniref:hypothetical protein n=1 Tax=unclassified Streptomyces TaxID=2593676 RepID=UPI002E2EF261|nr:MULTISPECIES: hypothetical protein [unclassified Streptomyces]WUC68477.1 hypothetical protein OG861_31970 [Streptomyces sp. NBC_00539]
MSRTAHILRPSSALSVPTESTVANVATPAEHGVVRRRAQMAQDGHQDPLCS